MKMSRIDTETDKSPNISKILTIFSEFSTDFVNWIVKKGQQGKNVFSSMLIKEVNAVFQTKTVQKWHPKKQNFETVRIFNIFVQFLSKYR